MNTKISSAGKAAFSGVATNAHTMPFMNTGKIVGGKMNSAIDTATVIYRLKECRKWYTTKMSRNKANIFQALIGSIARKNRTKRYWLKL